METTKVTYRKVNLCKNSSRKALVSKILTILVALIMVSSGLGTGVLATNQGGSQPTEPSTEPALSYLDWYQDYSTYNLNKLKRTKIPREAHALFLTGSSANSSKFTNFVEVMARTELNAMVIDIKEDEGNVTFKSDNPLVRAIDSDKKNFISDIDKLIHIAKENNIYLIARIVAFKDPLYAKTHPTIAFQRKTGGVWHDVNGVPWVDPYHDELWDYNVSIAKEVAEKGFDEIQYDYVRFPDKARLMDQQVAYAKPAEMSKAEVIGEFLRYAKNELEPYNVYLSADVYGATTTQLDDMGIGQLWELISPYVDYISPMMYPSHYGVGWYGVPYPDQEPYHIIKSGITDAFKKDEIVSAAGGIPAIIRPWYQDFTADWVPGYIVYGAHEVREQIRAGVEMGVNSYMIWNSGNNYHLGAWQ